MGCLGFINLLKKLAFLVLLIFSLLFLFSILLSSLYYFLLLWIQYFCFVFFLNKFIYVFLAVLGLCCCAQAFFSCSERGLLFFVAVRGLLIAVASLVAEHGL